MITRCRSYRLKRLYIVHKDTTFAGYERDEWWASLRLIIKPSIFVQGLVKQVSEFEQIEYVATHPYYYKLLMSHLNDSSILIVTVCKIPCTPKEIDTLSIQHIAHCLIIEMDKARYYWYMILIISSSRALAGQLKIMQELHSVCIFFSHLL